MERKSPLKLKHPLWHLLKGCLRLSDERLNRGLIERALRDVGAEGSEVKPAVEYFAELLELFAEPEEIREFGEKLGDLWTFIGKVVQACDLLIAQQD